MTRLCFLLLLSGLALQAMGQDHNDAEPEHSRLLERSYSLGAGLPWSFNFSTAGSNVRGYYNIGEQFCFGPEFYYLQADDTEIFDVDFIAHYIFNTPLVGTYPVLGANYTAEWEHTKNEGTHQESAFGATWGIGIHRHMGHFTAFAEYSEVESSLSDRFVTVGLLYTIHPEN